MDKIRKELRRLLDNEKLYLEKLEARKLVPTGSEIDYTMGKIRAYERALELMK